MKVISIAVAKTADLVKFYNDFADKIGATAVRKFADRATAEKRLADFVVKLAGADEAFFDLAEGFVPAPEGFDGETFESVDGKIVTDAPETTETTPEAGATDTVEDAEAKTDGAEPESKEADAGESTLTASNIPAGHNAFSMLVQSVEAAKKKAEEDGTPVVAKASNGSKSSNSDGVAASWVDSEVRAARLKRDGVEVTLDGKPVGTYKSTREAFRANRLPDNKHIRFRLKLKEAHRDRNEGATFEHNGKKYHFTIVSINEDGTKAE